MSGTPFTYLGYGLALALAVLAVAAVWGFALRVVGNRLMESNDFFQLLVRYAKEKNAKRVMGRDE